MLCADFRRQFVEKNLLWAIISRESFFSLFLLIRVCVADPITKHIAKMAITASLATKTKMPILVKNHQLGYVSEHSGGDSKTSQFWKVRSTALIDGGVSDQLAIQSFDELLNKNFSQWNQPRENTTSNLQRGKMQQTIGWFPQMKTLRVRLCGTMVAVVWCKTERWDQWKQFLKFEPLTGEDLTTAITNGIVLAKLEKGFTALNTFRNGGLYRVKGKRTAIGQLMLLRTH